MMSTLVCNQCSEVKVETSRSVVLPFVCEGCQRKAGANPTGEFPESLYVEKALEEADGALTEAANALENAEQALQDETATTMATVEMISDLESQLQVAKELAVGQTELIAQLEHQVEIVTDEKRVQETFIKALNEAGIPVTNELKEALLQIKIRDIAGEQICDELNASQSALAQVGAIAHALAFHYGYVSAKAQRLEQENGLLKKALDIVSAITGLQVRIIAQV